MKKIYYIIASAMTALCSGCNDGFLEVYPKDQQTEVTAFTTNASFKTYAWSLYEIFEGYSDTNFSDEINAGYFITKSNSAAGSLSKWATGDITVPANPENYEDTENPDKVTYHHDWDFAFIRQVNLMLDNIESSRMDEADKEHWRSVGYFFRAYRYMELLSRYGDVPWVEHVLNTHSTELTMPRTPRAEVADHILDNLQYAESHIRQGGDGNNTVNRNVVNALISRFGLFEGTWRKYHNLPDGEKFLKASIEASRKVLAAVPDVHTQYDALFNSNTDNMSKIKEVLLYKEYRNVKGEGHSRVRSLRTGEARTEATKDFVDRFLCTDGKPISTSDVYEGYKETDGSKKEYANFRNRDRRLYLTIIPPYMTDNARSGNITAFKRYEPTSPKAYADEFIQLINANSGSGWAGNKTLPASNFKNYYTTRMPNLWQSSNGVWNWQKAYMGYIPWKFYNTWVICPSNDSSNDSAAPIFRVGEVMLNYAEAACELGEFTQSIADATINKLRTRGGVAPMKVSAITDGWDKYREPDVNPLLWEIRRERIVELACEGFAFNDIRRWKKAESQLSKMPMGAYIVKADYGNPSSMKVARYNEDGTINTSNTLKEGHLYIFTMQGLKGWQPHYYLYPVPLSEQALNPNLTPNPGYDK
ncbi:RagB/SusD family nutrient uptake outer membrane protein [Bacteroides heparinolyticus]|uniref:RagB/SusD family nutrient uptake outer membrane protein n=1 Tax=Prevotella heparinolytica TaxID=28113 RepID=UPI0023F827BB|nr:RagB/SusD family nutrient uptake outer membrane protein [Bacteroides heparinolyticus]MCI6212835.1 RagB/SusD family nutrient uptake outer membrane protein [Bacteroides heparinolyticus]